MTAPITAQASAPLNTELNLADPDDVYEALIELHRDLTPTQSAMANAKLILLLVNHIGDRAVIDAAIRKARAGTAEGHLR
jgi:hypothetical protein